MDSIWFGFTVGRPTRCFEAVQWQRVPWDHWGFQCEEPALNSAVAPFASPLLTSTFLSAYTKGTPLQFLFCAIPNLLSNEMLSSYISLTLLHLMMLKNFSYFIGSCKTFPGASASPSAGLCQGCSVHLPDHRQAPICSRNKAEGGSSQAPAEAEDTSISRSAHQQLPGALGSALWAFSQLVLPGARNLPLSLLLPKHEVVAGTQNCINKYPCEMRLLIRWNK